MAADAAPMAADRIEIVKCFVPGPSATNTRSVVWSSRDASAAIGAASAYIGGKL